MKLLSVTILGEPFRILKNIKPYKFNENQHTNRLSTKVFAGKNGSGKSIFLELIAEIFYYLEIYHLKESSEFEKKGQNIGFEIEYSLPFQVAVKGDPEPIEHTEEDYYIRIRKEPDQLPEFSWKKMSEKNFMRTDENTQLLLPSKVIAYSSGQNELLSNPFYKMKYHYFIEIEKNNPKDINNMADNDRMFFLDYTSNFSIFISNFLLGEKQKLNYLKTFLKVDDIHSFRITINFVNYKKNKIPLNETLKKNIEKLKYCATSWFQRTQGKEDLLMLDYRVNQSTHEAFKFHFGSSFELFKTFYELEILNLNLVPVDTRGLILKAHKSLNLSDEMPKPDPSRLIFRIERIRLNKFVEEGKPPKTIYYKGLSDGEHQFNEVIGSVMMMEQEGCLFLMDEPDTHFNPKWRAKMIEMLNYVTASSYDDKGNPEYIRKQEIIITTHSPFVISDSQREDVYKFDGGLFENPELQTYGGSAGMLLETIFDRDISISDFSNDELVKLKEGIKTLDDIQKAKKELLKFGESVEKFDAYSFLQSKEEEFKNQKKK